MYCHMSPEGVNFISQWKSFETIINTRAKIHWTWYSAQLGTKDFIYIVFPFCTLTWTDVYRAPRDKPRCQSCRMITKSISLSRTSQAEKPSNCSKSQIAPIGLKNIHSLTIRYLAYWRLIPQETRWKPWKVRGNKTKPKPLPDIETLPHSWS